MTRSARPVTIMVLTITAFACGDTVTSSGANSHLIVVGGSGQFAPAGDTLPRWLVVRALDDAGRPLERYPITWTTPTGGVVEALDTVTGALGFARAKWRLGLSAGPQEAHAQILGYPDTATFLATAATGLKAVALMRSAWTYHMCALDAAGQAWCWGFNHSGQLGNGQVTAGSQRSTQSRVPSPVAGSTRFASLYAADATTCGLTLAGDLWCWGRNSRLFGTGGGPDSPVPVRAAPGLAFSSVDLDIQSHGCGVALDGAGYCWGDGALGDAQPPRSTAGPALVAGGHRWREIAAGHNRTCAVSVDGDVYCWSDLPSSLTWLGISPSSSHLVPTRVAIVSRLQSISLNARNQCGLDKGRAVCWGALGLGVTEDVIPGPVFPVVPNLVQRIQAEGESAVALTIDGRLWIWGEPPQCCDGWISSVPVPLEPAGPWIDFAISEFGVFAIRAADSSVFHWSGFEGFGPPTNLRPRAVPAP